MVLLIEAFYSPLPVITVLVLCGRTGAVDYICTPLFPNNGTQALQPIDGQEDLPNFENKKVRCEKTPKGCCNCDFYFGEKWNIDDYTIKERWSYIMKYNFDSTEIYIRKN